MMTELKKTVETKARARKPRLAPNRSHRTTITRLGSLLSLGLVAVLLATLSPLPAHAIPASPLQALPAQGQRLLVSDARLADLPQQILDDEVSSELAASVIAIADAAMTAATVKFVKDDGAEILQVSRTVLQRVQNLLLASELTGDRKYADRLWRDLAAAAAFPSWNPDHFLDTAEMAFAFALALDWGSEYWTSSQRTTLTTAIVAKGLTPSLPVYTAGDTPGPYLYIGNWTKRADNVNVVVNSAMAMAAMAVSGKTTSTVPNDVYNYAMASLDFGLEAYGDQGAFVEGPSYWAYATRYLVALMNSLITSFGNDAGLSADPGVAATATYILGSRGPTGEYFMFADTLDDVVPDSSLAGLAYATNSAALMSAAATLRSKTNAASVLIWRLPQLDNTAISYPSYYEDPGVGVSTMRNSATDSYGTFVGFRSGSAPAAGHQHQDAGDFTIQALGETWAVGLGRDEATYNLAGEQASRWDYYRLRPEGHNTLSIDNQLGGAASWTAPSHPVRSGTSPVGSFTIADLTNMSAGVTSWRRGIELDNSRSEVRVQDEITTSKRTGVLWSMHTKADIRISSDGKSAVLYQNGQRLEVSVSSPTGARFEQSAAAPYAASPNPSQATNTGVRKLIIRTTIEASGTLVVDFKPLMQTQSTGSSSRAVVPLDNWAAQSNTSELSGLTVGGQPLNDFSAGTHAYHIPILGPAAPVVTGTTVGGTVAVTQAAGMPGVAKITVAQAGRSASEYQVYFYRPQLPIASARITASDGGRAEYTYDGKIATSWHANRDKASITWTLGDAYPVKSMSLLWTRSSTETVQYRIERSVDGSQWTLANEGSFSGPGARQNILLPDAPAATQMRLTVFGSARLNEVSFYSFDSSASWFTPPASVLENITLEPVAPNAVVGDQGTLTWEPTWSGPAASASVGYVSSDPTVVRVASDGSFVARKAGIAQLGVVVKSGGVVKWASVTVTVTDPVRVRIYVAEDSYVDGGSVSTNYGSSYILRSKPLGKTTNERLALMKFDLSSLAGKTVTSAVLSAESIVNDTTALPEVVRVDAHAATGAWSETAVTWNNKPAMGATVGSLISTRTLGQGQADLTDYVKSSVANGAAMVSLGLTQDDVGLQGLLVNISSRESGKPAYIDVTLAPATGQVPAGVLKSVTITGVPEPMPVGTQAKPTISVTDSLGRALAGSALTFTSSAPGKLTVSSSGVLQAIAVGTSTVTVTAKLSGVIATSSVTVTVADPVRVRIFATEDSYVDGGSVSTNYGSSWVLRSKPLGKTTNERLGLMKFDLSSLAGKTVTSAVLSAESIVNDTTALPEVVRVDAHAATGAWSETAVTWNNKPAMGATVGSFISTRTLGRGQADLTDYIKSFVTNGAGAMSLGLTQDDVGTQGLLVNVSSRESGQGAYIDVTLAPATATIPPGVLKSVALSGVPEPMTVGSQVQPTISVLDSIGRALPGSELTFTSSTPSVLTVSPSGALQAVAVGTSTITVTAKLSGVIATSSITVTVADPVRVRIYVTEDSYVDGGSVSTNYGSSHTLRAKPLGKTTNERIALLKFDLSSLSGKVVTSAVLSAESIVNDTTPLPDVVRVDAHAATGSWTETGVTWSNKPAMGATVGSFISTRTLGQGQADLTDYIKTFVANGAGAMSLGLTQDDVGTQGLLVNVSSRESGKPAYIDITLAPATGQVPPGVLKTVSLSGVPQPMTVGSQAQPTISVTDSIGRSLPGSTLTFTSSAPEVLTVSASGVLQAVAAGTATVTVTSTLSGVIATSSTTVTVANPG